MIESGEVINLVVDIFFLLILLFMIPIRKLPILKKLTTGYSLLVASHLATVLEGFFLMQVLNFLEHLFFLLAVSYIAFLMFQNTFKEGV